MIRDFISAFRGRIQWLRLCNRYTAGRYMIMPHKQEQYNDYALQYLTAYMKKEKVSSLCMITCDKKIYSKARTKAYPPEYHVQVLFKSENWIHHIIKYYALYEFSNKIKIISLTEPYDNCAENLLGVHGTTKRELLCYDILSLSEIPD